MTVDKRFRVLRFIAIVLKVLAWLILLAGIVLAGIILATGIASGPIENVVARNTGLLSFFVDNAILLAGAAGLGAFLAALFYFLLLYATSEAIYLQLSIEENTRLTSVLLHKISQEDTPPVSANELPPY